MPNHQPDTMQAIAIPAFGGADVLQVVDHPVPTPAPHEVLVRIAAAGLNRGDIVQRQGNYPPPPGISLVPGLEVSGTVVALGAQVSRWRVGDSVCALLAGGGYAEYCVVPEGQCLPIPSGVSLSDAAALPEAFCTVWNAVWQQGRLGPGETLLLHGGSSGIGVTAIQIARALGHTVFATAGSQKKCEACISLGATHAINYRQEDFASVVLAETAGRGVDVVLDMVGGPYLKRNLSCLSMYGRQISIGLQAGTEGAIDLRELMLRRLTLIGTTLRSRSVDYKSDVCRSLEKNIWPLISSGAIRPIIERTFPMHAVSDAHRLLESSEHIGKILIAPHSTPSAR